MMHRIQFLLPVVAAIVIASCGCPTLEPIDIRDRRVREATITRFDPSWDVVRNEPAPEYSIHNFLFPNDITSSGTLPNDLRVAGGKSALLTTNTFTALDPASPPDSAEFTAEFYTRSPDNGTLVGDLVVVSVDMTAVPPVARIRVYGSLGKFTDPLQSGSATDFVQYIESHEAEFPIVAGTATSGGRNLPSATRASVVDSVRVVDDQGRDVTAQVQVPQALRDAADTEFRATEIEVRPGEVYYYRARNGVEFAVLIEDVFRASLSPNLRRMTIKFAELRTLQQCSN